MRKRFDASLMEVLRRFGTAKSLAEKLGITNRAVANWKMIPAKHVKYIAITTGMHPYRIRPDLYIEGFWNLQMNTADIATEMKLPEPEVCRYLAMVIARRRTSSSDSTIASLPPVSEPPMESD